MALRVIRSDGQQVLAKADSSGAIITHEKSLQPMMFKKFRFDDAWIEIDSGGGRLMQLQLFNNCNKLGYFFFHDGETAPTSTWTGGEPPANWGVFYTGINNNGLVPLNFQPNGIEYATKLWCRFRFWDGTINFDLGSLTPNYRDRIEFTVLYTNDVQA